MGLLRRIFDTSSSKIAFVYHPYSQSILEVSYEDALILKLYESGFNITKISELLKINEKNIATLLLELENQLKTLKPKEELHYNNPTTLWLMTDLRCNMKCKYCYTSFGSFNLTNATKNIEFETTKYAMDTLLRIFPSLKSVNIFGGGEPLLSFDIIKQLIEYVELQGYDIRFGIVTNATLLNREVAEFFHIHKVRVTISIDGPTIVNDVNRVFSNGTGSHQKIVQSINLLKELGENFFIQATYTPEVFELGYELTDVVDHLRKFTPYILIKNADYVPS